MGEPDSKHDFANEGSGTRGGVTGGGGEKQKIETVWCRKKKESTYFIRGDNGRGKTNLC